MIDHRPGAVYQQTAQVEVFELLIRLLTNYHPVKNRLSHGLSQRLILELKVRKLLFKWRAREDSNL